MEALFRELRWRRRPSERRRTTLRPFGSAQGQGERSGRANGHSPTALPHTPAEAEGERVSLHKHISQAEVVGADKIIGVDFNPEREAMARKFGMTHFINPKTTENVVDAITQLTDGGADYSFECIGNTKVMRQALECTHKGWGRSIIIGVAEAGAEISTRPFQLVTGRKWEGSAFGGARGRTDVPKIVDWYMEGKINIDDLITHTTPCRLKTSTKDLI